MHVRHMENMQKGDGQSHCSVIINFIQVIWTLAFTVEAVLRHLKYYSEQEEVTAVNFS